MALEQELIESPDLAPIIERTGRLRKLRFTPPGSRRGKSGAYRVCYAHFPAYGTIALFVVFGKNERADVTAAEARAIAKALKEFESQLRRDVKRRPKRGPQMSGSKPTTSLPTGQTSGRRRSRNGSSPGTRIVAAINEATEILRTEGLASKQLTIRAWKVPPTPRAYEARDVRRVRNLLGASQAVLARFLGVNVNTVRSWEQGRRFPQPVACRFLAEIESDPTYWRERIGRVGLENGPVNRPNS